MTSLQIDESQIGDLTGKVALITGGASGIGFAAASILHEHGAAVHILDLYPPSSSSVPPVTQPLPENFHFHSCDVNNWPQLRSIFSQIGRLDYVFANAGISEDENFLADTYQDETETTLANLTEPAYPLLDTNFRAVLNTIKLAHHSMKHSKTHGSIVITSSSTAYAPEFKLPLYSAIKLGLVGLVRSLRHVLPEDGITINGVVPASTETKLIPQEFVGLIKQAGLPISSARHVGLALVYSAVAREERRVEVYGKDEDGDLERGGRWNGRVILTMEGRFTEIEGGLVELKEKWFGRENLEMTRWQQSVSDFRVRGGSE